MSGGRAAGWAGAGLAVGVPLLVGLGLWGVPPGQLGELRAITAYADSHTWVFERLLQRSIGGDGPLEACLAGYPQPRTLRALGWAPAVLYAGLRMGAGPMAAGALTQLAALPLSGLAAWAWLRRVSDPLTAGILGATWATSATLLGALSTGEVSNTQGWTLPLALIAASGAPAPRALAGLLLVSVATAFTSPYYALCLPFLVLLGALGAAPGAGPGARARAVGGALAATALGLLPGVAYYDPAAAGGGESLFRPARRALRLVEDLPRPPPVASLEQLLIDTVPGPGSPWEVQHPAAVGVGLLLVAGAGLLLRPAGWRSPAALLGLGLVLSLGPVLYVGGGLVELGGRPLALPVYALEAMGWPAGQGGLYYRYAVLAGLGAAGLAAAVLRGRPALAALLLAAQLGQAVTETGPLWPRPTAPLAGRAALGAIAAGPPGAVLELPLQGPADEHLGQAALLRAVVHGRPTTALPRGNLRGASPVGGVLARAAGAGAAGRRMLTEAGIGWVLLPEELVEHVQPDLPTLLQLLGPPRFAGDGLIAWELGAAAPACAPG